MRFIAFAIGQVVMHTIFLIISKTLIYCKIT